ncbi:hypothetical protein ACO0LO_13845 [Undibacterium sp. TJN25]
MHPRAATVTISQSDVIAMSVAVRLQALFALLLSPLLSLLLPTGYLASR